LNVETDMLISILKLTKDGPVSHETINKDVRFPAGVVRELLRKLQNDGLLNVQDNMVETSDVQRLELAVRALRAGADIERVSDLLRWKEFEAMAAVAFEHNSYSVLKNLHFKYSGRKYEIDIVGCRKPLVVCVDCKHWHHGLHKSTLEKVVKEQIERVRALTESLPNPRIKIECVSWSSPKFVPVILSLITDESKFYGGVPVVPIVGLQDFLNQLPAYADSLLSIKLGDVKKSSSSQKSLL